MKFIKYNVGIIAIFLLMVWMAYNDYKAPKEPGENMHVLYLVTALILAASLAMIYFKHYGGRNENNGR